MSFDGFAIDQCGLIAPTLERFDHAGNQVHGAGDGPDGRDLAILGDSGVCAHELAGAGANWSGLRIDAGNQSADNYSRMAMEGPVRIP